MGLAGMNDRDNTNNEARSKDISSSYGMSSFKPKRKKIDTSGNRASIINGYLFHVNSYPSNYYPELMNLATALIHIVHNAKKQHKELLTYQKIKNSADAYLDKIVVLTCKAYNVQDLLFDEFDFMSIVEACKNPVPKAMAYLVSMLCNRGKALNRLTSEEQNIIFSYPHKCYEFEKNIYDAKQQIKELDCSLKTYSKMFKDLGIEQIPKSIITAYDDELQCKSHAKELINLTQNEYDKYLVSISKELKHIWNKIIHYNHT